MTAVLLLLASFAAATVIGLPPVRGSSASLFVSASSGRVGAFLTVSGSGFGADLDVGIEFGSTPITVWGQASSIPTSASILDTAGVQSPEPFNIRCTVLNPCIETDANGAFAGYIAVPPVAGGSEPVTVSDGTNVVTVPFVVNPAVVISDSPTSLSRLFTSGFPDQSVGGLSILLTGFPPSDSVTVSSRAFTTAIPAITTGASTAAASDNGGAGVPGPAGTPWTSGPGIGSLVGTTLSVAETAGGSVAVTATGTSGTTASTTFTINPVVALYNSQTGPIVFSVLSSGPLLLAGYGFPAGTILQNSVTLGGVSTQHSAITIGSSGTFGAGSNNHVVVIPNQALPTGSQTLSVSDGVNKYVFSYALNDIAAAQCAGHALGTDCAGNLLPLSRLTGETSTNNPIAIVGSLAGGGGIGGPLIVSNNDPTGASGTGTVQTDATGYQPNDGAYVTLFGSNFRSGDVVTSSTTFGAGGTPLTFGASTADNNGAFYVVGRGSGVATSCNSPTTPAANTHCLDEEPNLSNGAAVSVTGGTPGSVLMPSILTLPWVFTTNLQTISFGTRGSLVSYHGFDAGGTCTLGASDGTLSVNGGSCMIGTNGAVLGLPVTSPGMVAIDLPGGPFTLQASDGTVTSSRGANATYTAGGLVIPSDLWGGTAGTTALSINGVAAGTSVIMRSGPTYGPQGLLANTHYSLLIDPGQPSEQVLGGFVSSALGTIPTPGVQFTVPAGQIGNHELGFNFSDVPTNEGTRFVSGNATGDAPIGAGLAGSGVLDGSNNGATSISGTTRGVFQDGLLVNIGGSITVAPSVGNVGSTIGLTGGGLTPSTAYDVSLAMGTLVGNSPVPNDCPPNAVGPSVVQSFTATSSGLIPAGLSFPFPSLPTFDGGTFQGSAEGGTLYCVDLSTPNQFALGQTTSHSSFTLQATANENMTSAPVGHSVTLNANGLAADSSYDILFNYQISPPGGTTWAGTTVGAILSNSVGTGSSTFTVPSVSAGTYTVQLQKSDFIGEKGLLIVPPTLTVSSSSAGGGCLTTTCMVLTGTPSEVTIGSNRAIAASYTNTSNGPVMATVYGVLHNALGQTVFYTTSPISPASGATATVDLVLFGLAPGTYSATIFVTSTGGTAISTTSTVNTTI